MLMWGPTQSMQLTCCDAAFCNAKSEATASLCGQQLSAASVAAHLTMQFTFCRTAKHQHQCSRQLKLRMKQLTVACTNCSASTVQIPKTIHKAHS